MGSFRPTVGNRYLHR